jgi:3-oxoacyl-[acyl-carrier protein] reductase
MEMAEVIVITGTSKGIGRYLIEYYLEKGYIVAGCSRNSVEFEAGRYFHYVCDVAKEIEVKSMVQDIYRKYKRIDVLINNAGIASMNHLLMTPIETVDKVFRTNVFGTFLFVRETAKVMVKAKAGKIINFATVATPLKLEGEATYAASKAAVETFTKIFAGELAPFNITVNAIGPTPVKTDLIRGVPKAKMNALLNRQNIRRFGRFEDISNVIDFFIRPESEFITGQIIYLGGIS